MKYKIGDTVIITNGEYKGCVGKIIVINENYARNYFVMLYADDVTINKGENEIEIYKSYEDGLNDAWKFARELGDLPTGKIEEIFNGKYEDYYDVINHMSPQEALDTFNNWEESINVNVGDIVVDNDGIKAVLLSDVGCDLWNVFTENACVEEWCCYDFKKTDQKLDKIVNFMLDKLRKG